MSDCNITPFEPVHISLASDSPIFRRINQLVANVRMRNYDLRLPHIGDFNLGADVGAVGTALQIPDEPLLTPPELQDVAAGALQVATYSALNSAIHFSHSSPLVPPLAYANGQGHLDLPSVTKTPPPVEYPLAARIAQPATPSLPALNAPELTLGNRPAFDSVSRLEFKPTQIEPLEMPHDLLSSVEQISSMQLELPQRTQEKYTNDANVINKLKQLLSGQDEIAAWVAQQVVLYEADEKQFQFEIKRKQDEVFEQSAAKNFALPNGMVDAQIVEIARMELVQRQDLINKIESDVVDTALNMLFTSIDAAIRIEQYHASLYFEYVRQNIETYKLNVAAATAVFNGLLKAYEVYTDAVRQHVENYNRYADAVTDQNRAVAAGLDISAAEIAAYNASVTMYRADNQTLRDMAEVSGISVKTKTLPLQVYEAELRGLLVNHDIFKTNVQAYKQAIQNYARSFQLTESEIASFASAVRAETSKASVDDANVSAYVRALGAERQRISSYEDYIRSSTSVLESEVQNLRAAMDAERSYLTAANDVLQANIQALRNYIGVAQTQQEVVNAYNHAKVVYTRDKDRLALAAEELQFAKQMIHASEIAQTARLKSALEEIKVRANGALAQAASTIYNVGISAMGTAQQTVAGTLASSDEHNFSTRLAWNRSCRQEVRAPRG